MAAKGKKANVQNDMDLDELPSQSAKKTNFAEPAKAEKAKQQERVVPEPNVKKQKDKTKKKKKGGGLASKILPVFIILLIIASLVGILYYNVFNIRDKYLRSTLEKLPLVGNMLPPVQDDTDPYSGLNHEQLIAQISLLESQLAKEKTATQDANKRIEIYLQEIENLKVFQDQQLEFKDEKAEFDRQIAEGDPTAYARYYESISPENAESLYVDAARSAAKSEELKKYIRTIEAMDASSAAKMLEELVPTDMDIVVDIMKSIHPEHCGEILSSMTTLNSAAVVKRMTPTD